MQAPPAESLTKRSRSRRDIAERLCTSNWHSSQKRRVASPRGHLSNRQAAEAACALAPHGLKDLVLAHLSNTNNSPMRATGTVRQALKAAGHGGVRVRAAIAGHPTPWIEVGAPLDAGQGNVYRYDDGGVGLSRLFDFG